MEEKREQRADVDSETSQQPDVTNPSSFGQPPISQSLGEMYHMLSQGGVDTWLQTLQSTDMPSFTMPELMQACTQVLEQLCNVNVTGDEQEQGSDDWSQTLPDEALIQSFVQGSAITVQPEAFIGYVEWLEQERVGFSCLPHPDGQWLITPVKEV